MSNERDYNYYQKFSRPITPEEYAAYVARDERRRAEQAARLQRWHDYADAHPRGDLIRALIEESGNGGELGHMEADKILLQLIGDDVVSEIFGDMHKWYA